VNLQIKLLEVYAISKPFKSDISFQRIYGSPAERSIKIKGSLFFESRTLMRMDWTRIDNSYSGGFLIRDKEIWRKTDGHWQAAASLELTLAGEAGISSGVAVFLPFLLLGDTQLLRGNLFDRIAHSRGFEIHHSMMDDTTMSLALDKKRRIRRVVQNYKLGNKPIRETTIYQYSIFGPKEMAVFVPPAVLI